MNNDQKQNLLRLSDFFDIVIAPEGVNIPSSPLLLILDYAPPKKTKKASFAVSLSSYSNNTFLPRCWITEEKVKSGTIKGHSSYKEFTYKGKTFYPFSVSLAEYCPHDINHIKQLIEYLYDYIEFGDK